MDISRTSENQDEDTMPLTRRSRPRQVEREVTAVESSRTKGKMRGWCQAAKRKNIVAVSLRWLLLVAFVTVMGISFMGSSLETTANKISMNTVFRNIGSDASLQVDFSPTSAIENNTVATTLGPHKVTISVKTDCKNPQIWLRLVGDILVSIPLHQSHPGSWSSTFDLPVKGRYAVDARWYGCEGSISGDSFSELSQPLELVAQETAQTNNEKWPLAWMTSKKFIIESGSQERPHIFTTTDPALPPETVTLLPASSSLGTSLVVKEVTPVPDKVADLSNYEIVCFMGSESAAAIWEAFLSLRPHIANTQRPFKFHYRNITDFEKPDKHWNDEANQKFRKCKIVVVSLDRLEKPVSQAQYTSQVKTFLGHVVKALNDTTFPIHMTTVNSHPITDTSMCHSPLEWNPGYHPCNDALRKLFHESHLPKHVYLMDNTDLSGPMLEGDLNDVFAVIALRVYAIVGMQVEEWRKHGQQGTKAGLLRGSELEPNRAFVKYDWT